MNDYRTYLESIYDPRTFARKVNYIRYNFGADFSAGQRVLEIGPGLGEFITYCNRVGIHDVDVIDRDPGIAEYIRAKYRVEKLWTASAEDIPTIESELRSYDRIFMLHILEHVRKDLVVPVIQSLYRRLNPGGLLIMIIPNGGTPLAAVERYHDFTHEGAFSENSLRQIAQMANLPESTAEVRGYFIPPYELINLPRIAVQKALHLLLKLMMIANGSTHLKIYTPHLVLRIRRGGA